MSEPDPLVTDRYRNEARKLLYGELQKKPLDPLLEAIPIVALHLATIEALRDFKRRAEQELNTPYQCYWRDRAFAAEKACERVQAELAEAYRRCPALDPTPGYLAPAAP